MGSIDVLTANLHMILRYTPIAFRTFSLSLRELAQGARPFYRSHWQSTRMASTTSLKAEKLFNVKDYVCVVTGGGTGIGLMASQALAANGTHRVSKLLTKGPAFH